MASRTNDLDYVARDNQPPSLPLDRDVFDPHLSEVTPDITVHLNCHRRAVEFGEGETGKSFFVRFFLVAQYADGDSFT